VEETFDKSILNYLLADNYKKSTIKIFDLGLNKAVVKIEKGRHWGIVNEKAVG